MNEEEKESIRGRILDFLDRVNIAWIRSISKELKLYPSSVKQALESLKDWNLVEIVKERSSYGYRDMIPYKITKEGKQIVEMRRMLRQKGGVKEEELKKIYSIDLIQKAIKSKSVRYLIIYMIEPYPYEESNLKCDYCKGSITIPNTAFAFICRCGREYEREVEAELLNSPKEMILYP